MTESKPFIFVPSGTVVVAIKQGIPVKQAIELHGPDAGTFVSSDSLSDIDKNFIETLKTKSTV